MIWNFMIVLLSCAGGCCNIAVMVLFSPFSDLYAYGRWMDFLGSSVWPTTPPWVISMVHDLFYYQHCCSVL